jgi:hypothetical protein
MRMRHCSEEARFSDMFVVALLIEKSLDMFRSPLGTWVPFLLIFLSSWVTGNLVRPKP